VTTRELALTPASLQTAQDLAIVTQPTHREVLPDLVVEGRRLLVSVERVLLGKDADAAWLTYRESLAPLGGVAAMKQTLSEAALRAVMADPAIVKYVGWGPDGDVVAVATMTDRLETENISSRFFAERYPEHYATGRLLYLGFLVVRPEAQAQGMIMRLIGRFTADLEAAGAVVAFDVCAYNDETFAFARLCRLVAARTRQAELTMLDVQTYYALEFPPQG
jgi:hypothetical protein